MKGLKTTLISILVIGLLAGSAVGVAAQDEEAAAVKGSLSPVAQLEPDLCGLEEDVNELEDGTVSWIQCFGLVTDDPRLTADGSAVMSLREYDGFGLVSSRVEIANEGGSWSGAGTRVFMDGDPEIDIEQLVLTGAGGYDGLTAILFADRAMDTAERSSDSWNGVISSGQMPELPSE